MQRLRTKRNGLLVLGVAAIALLLAIPAFAQLKANFELDGNIVKDGKTDWGEIFDAAGQPTGEPDYLIDAGFTPDFQKDPKTGAFISTDTSTFTTGSKDTLDIDTGWQCKKSNNIGDKVDIVNAYATALRDSNGDLILYFGVEKASPNGDSNIAMWFLQDPTVKCQANGGGAKSFTGKHVNGDLLVVSAFTNGGTQANVDVYEWMNGSLVLLTSVTPAEGANCKDIDAASSAPACAITNDKELTPLWEYFDKDGGPLNPLEFFEGGVNLSHPEIGLDSTCFARFLANTRSSQSLTATIFDFAVGELETCHPNTALTATATAEVTYTFAETNAGDVSLTEPTEPTSGGWVTSSDCTVSPTTSGGYNVGDTSPANGKLDPGETFMFTCTKTITFSGTPVLEKVTAVGHGIDPAGRDITVCSANADPAVCYHDGDETDSVTVEIK